MEVIHDKFLYRACQECVADAGKEDDTLVNNLYKYMYENYNIKSKAWNYDIIDMLIEEWSANAHVSYREIVSEDNILTMAILGEKRLLVGSSECSYLPTENAWYYNRLYVKPEYRGHHIGSCLLDNMLKYVNKKKAILFLDINPYGDMSYQNLEAFYKRHGFVDNKITKDGYAYKYIYNGKEH